MRNLYRYGVLVGLLSIAGDGPALAQSCPCSIWPASAAPVTVDGNDGNAIEVGVKFRVDVSGFVTGIRFYKGATDTGTHTGHLWSSDGTLLASVSFSSETTSGWQQANFSAPAAVAAGTTYVASYFAPNGHYPFDQNVFASAGVDDPPLHALASGVDGSNGVYSYGTASSFPSSSFNSSNYWVDVVFTTSGAPAGPVVTSFLPANGTATASVTTAVTATFNESVDPTTITGPTFQLHDASNNLVSATVTYNSTNFTATLQPTSPLAESTNYTAVVQGGGAGPSVKDLSGIAMASSVTWSFATVSAPGGCPCSIWPQTATPSVVDSADPPGIELGVRFRSDVNGYITGIRFYKSATNIGSHQGNLWSNTGTLLASGTFTAETASGWQELDFGSPVAITGGTTYVASYYAPAGHYSFDGGFFATNGVDNIPLHALADKMDGSNGIFNYGAASSFPTSTYGSSNYWVDVVFNTTIPSPPPVVTATSPANGASNVATTTPVTATFNAAIDPTSLSSSTFVLLDNTGAPVPGTLSYNAATFTAIMQPSSALNAGAGYTASLPAGGVRSPAGAPLAATTTWSFFTASASQPPVVTSFSPAAGMNSVNTATPVTATFSKAIDPTTLTGASFQLLDPSSNVVSAIITYNASTLTAVLQPTVPLAYVTSYTAILRAGFVKDTQGHSLPGNVSWSFTTMTAPPTAPQCPCTLWSAAATPTTPDAGEANSVELGVKFRTDLAGYVTGVRFYKSQLNIGTHVGNLWTSAGTLLSTATFDNESTSGWQQVNFAAPVPVAANTTYIVSYFSPAGHYAFTMSAFASAGLDNPPLHALANGFDGGNGVYTYGSSSTFPSSTYSSGNYWVDFVFVANDSTTPPSVISTAPAAGTTAATVGAIVTAAFSEPMNPATITSNSLQLVDSSNNAIAGTVSYDAPSASIVFTPSGGLVPQTTYTATVANTVTDVFGNAIGQSFQWSFTTAPPPPNAGPGGPILVISTAQNPFTRYLGEILSNEGLNEYTVQDLSTVTAATLSAYDIVILGDMSLSSSEAAMITSWVMNGGRLIAMHPDKQLAGLLGLSSSSGTLSNQYLAVNTLLGPGVGIVADTIQYHGPADLYTLNGATAYAMLYSGATTPTAAPAVTWMQAGAGQAAAFTYDLARSVVYSRQGNPAWSGEQRNVYIDPTTGIGLIQVRSDDLYYGAASFDPEPDWIDLNKVAIPQADEQQRLLANLIEQMNASAKPLPRFWYLPSGFKAAVIMTGDDHNVGNTSPRFDQYLADSPAGCSVSDWTCIRATSNVWPLTPIPNYQTYIAEGFEITNHVDNSPDCTNFTADSLAASITSELATFYQTFPGIPAPTTNRTHCVLWSDYDTEPQVELSFGIRLDTTYYYWPQPWIQDRPGMFTGSGMPMRFTDRSGNIIDVYQAVTQMPDESLQTFPNTINTLLDNALGPQGFYGVFTTNMHTDFAESASSDFVVASAMARGVPVVTQLQMLTWLDGRNGSSFGSFSWNGGVLSFTITAASGAKNLQAMLPAASPAGVLKGITLNGTPVSFTLKTVKGTQYATFTGVTGSYQATYATPYAISGTITGGGANGALITVSGGANTSVVSAANGSFMLSGLTNGSYTITPALSGYIFTPASAKVTVSGASVTGINFSSALAVSTSVGVDTMVSNDSGQSSYGTNTSVTSPPLSVRLGNELLLAFVAAGDPGTGVQETVSSVSGGGLTWTLVQRTNTQPGTAEIWRAMTPVPLNGITVTANFSTAVPSSTITVAVLGGVKVSGNGSGAIGAIGSGNAADWTPATASLVTMHNNSFVYGIGNDLGRCVNHSPDTGQTVVHEYFDPNCLSYWVQQQTSANPKAGTTVTIDETDPEVEYYNLSIVEIVPILPTYSISGKISGSGGSGATVSLSGGSTASTVADASGNFTLSGVESNTYTVTPSLLGWAFTPASTQVVVGSANVTGVNFTSTGVPVVSLSPANLSFVGQLEGTQSAGQNLTLKNAGHATLSISGVSIEGDNPDQFADTTTCGTTLAVGASCTITVKFTPTLRGVSDAVVQILSNADSSPDTVPLTGTATGPVATLSKSSLAFGNQMVNTTSAPQTVNLSNTGEATMSITGLSITGTNGSSFSKTSTCGVTLGAGVSCTISITFTPASVGSVSAALSISDNADGSPQTVSLSGTGMAPVASISPASVTFGVQAVNTSSSASVVTLRNSGNATMTISSTAITGTNAGDFSRTTTCGSSLGAGSSCTISVTFKPTAVGTRTASVSITDNAAGSPQTVPLTGTGTGVSLTPSSLTFSSRSVGTTSTAQTVTLRNVGTAALTGVSTSLTGTNPGDYAQTTTCGTTLAVGTSCTISVTFTPTATGTRTATLSVADSDPTSPQLTTLSGTGTAPVASISPASVTFGVQAVNTSSSASVVTLRNSGNATMTISSTAITGTNAGDFSRTTTCGSSLGAGSSCTISVTFKPTAAGTRTASVSITDNAAGSPQTVPLTGTGTSVSLTPSSLTFSSRSVGTTSTAQTVTLRNVGTAVLTGVSTSLTGTNPGDYAQTTTCGATLAVGTSCTISVTFTPTATGTRTATLSVADSDPTSPQLTTLSGTGTAPVASISPASVTFGVQAVNTSSSASVVTLRNSGNATMTISSTAITGTNAGDFSRTTTCGSSLGAGSSCTISVTFKPTAAGTRTASVSITDNAAGSPQTVPLTGTGTGVSLTPSSLTFSTQRRGTTSTAQTVTLRNVGTAALTGISTSLTGTNPGDYAQTTTCGTTLAVGTSCTISVTFKPTATGTRTATLRLADSDPTSPQTTSLTGTGS